MLVDFICPKGHRWQTQESQTGAMECPECGSDGDRIEVTLQSSTDEGTIDATAEFTLAGRKSAMKPLEEPPEDPPPVIPGYEVLECLGRGGMGAVYRAVDSKLNRQVALKVIALGPNPRQEDLLRFQIEAESLASLQHANIVQVHDVGEVKRQPYLAMELVEGPSLEAYLKEHRLTPNDAASMCAKIALAVHATHQRGIVHRDLKPANILIAEDDEPKLTDFGLAKRIENDSAITRPGMVVGTPSYMAPEQADGESNSVGPRSDVYSLGAVLYEMLAGRKPFVADTVLRTLEMIRVEEPSPLSRYVKHVPRDLETICLKCLEKSPDRRYQTAGELADDLHRYLNGEPVVARPLGVWERSLKWTRRRPALAASIALVAVGMLAGALGAVWHHRQILAERDATHEYFELSREAVDVMLVEVAEEHFASNPHMNEKREAILETALEFYERLYAKRKATASARVDVAEAKIRLGDVYRWLDRDADDLQRSESAYRQGIDMLLGSPASESQMQHLANGYQGVGQVHYKTGKLDEAEQAFRSAVVVFRALVIAGHRNPTWEAEVASCYQHLANCLIDTNRAEEAEELLNSAIEALESIVQRDDTDAKSGHKLAQSHLTLGNLLRQLNRHEEVESAYLRSIELFAKLHDAHPENAIYHSHLAQATANLGNHYITDGKLDAAEGQYKHASNQLTALVDKYQSTAEYRQAAANTLNSLAAVHYQRAVEATEGNAEVHRSAAEDQLRDAIEHQRVLIKSNPQRADFQGDLGMTLGNLAGILLDGEQPKLAKPLIEEALAALAIAREQLPGHAEYLAAQEYQYDLLAKALVRLDDLESAMQQADQCQQMAETNEGDTRSALAYLNRLLLEIAEKSADPSPVDDESIDRSQRVARQVVELAVKRGTIEIDAIEADGPYQGLARAYLETGSAP